MRLSILLVLTGICSFGRINGAQAQTIFPKQANWVDEDKFPTPAENIQRLFYLQRLPNANTIIYELNAPNGHIDEDEPIHPYWIRYANKNERDDLNYIQRKFAYGLATKKIGAEQWDVRFVSYKKIPLLLMKGNDGKYHIFATIAQKQMEVNRIFAKIEGGSFWVPNIVYVEFKGTDPLTRKEIVERFKP